MTAGSTPVGISRSYRRPVIGRRVLLAILVASILAIPVALELATRRQARTLFASLPGDGADDEALGPRELRFLSQAQENLGQDFGGHGTQRIVEQALRNLEIELEAGLIPTSSDVDHLSRILEAYGERLDAEVAEKAIECVVDLILATRDTALVFRLRATLRVLGGRLSADAAEEAVARMVGRILGTGDVNQLDFRSQALQALGTRLSSEAAERAAVPIIEGIADARDLHQLVFLSQALEAFRKKSPPGGSTLGSS